MHFFAGWPLLYAEEGAAIGVKWPKGILLHGPPGCGKTLVARSVAAEFDAEVHEISAASVFGSYTGRDNACRTCLEIALASSFSHNTGVSNLKVSCTLLLCHAGQGSSIVSA